MLSGQRQQRRQKVRPAWQKWISSSCDFVMCAALHGMGPGMADLPQQAAAATLAEGEAGMAGDEH